MSLRGARLWRTTKQSPRIRWHEEAREIATAFGLAMTWENEAWSTCSRPRSRYLDSSLKLRMTEYYAHSIFQGIDILSAYGLCLGQIEGAVRLRRAMPGGWGRQGIGLRFLAKPRITYDDFIVTPKNENSGAEPGAEILR